MNFPVSAGASAVFFFFQEFGCGPGGCHPFIFECTMPSRRKGMKGVGDLPPQRFASIQLPVSLPGEH